MKVKSSTGSSSVLDYFLLLVLPLLSPVAALKEIPVPRKRPPHLYELDTVLSQRLLAALFYFRHSFGREDVSLVTLASWYVLSEGSSELFWKSSCFHYFYAIDTNKRCSSKVLRGTSLAMPFSIVRLTYAFLSVYCSSETWNSLTGPVTAFILMGLLMEYCVVLIYLYTGFSIKSPKIDPASNDFVELLT
jgi:hypothetical protein